jgi:hypothetical protein
MKNAPSAPAAARAQTPPPPAEELEPRVVGGAGITTVGLSGFVDTLSSSEDGCPRRGGSTHHCDGTRLEFDADHVSRVGAVTFRRAKTDRV